MADGALQAPKSAPFGRGGRRLPGGAATHPTPQTGPAAAGAWGGALAANARAVISRPMKTRMGPTAASGRSPTSSDTTPTMAPTPTTRPGASVEPARAPIALQAGGPMDRG